MKQIGNYQVEDTPLGSGGMGQVLKGTDASGRSVAIKEILPEFVTNLEYRSRIDKEIAFLRQLENKNVVKIYDHFQLNDNYYIVMEMVEGEDFEKYIEKHGPMDPAEAAGLMVKLLDTMQYVHDMGVVHRDLKPSNIMMRPNGDVCVLDFGIAKNTMQTGEDQTVVGTVLGTDGYMSPEQANGMALDSRTDIYSLGCVLFYLITGQHPFLREGTDFEIQMDINSKPFPRVEQFRKDVAPQYQQVLDIATDKNMLRRFQTCEEFAEALKEIIAPRQPEAPAQVQNQPEPAPKPEPEPAPAPQPETQPAGPQRVKISLGREKCDICVAQKCNKVSRHHADVEYVILSGEQYFAYTDCSTNGTVIDGRQITKGMTCKIPFDHNPEILLSTDPKVTLDWDEVRSALMSLARHLQVASCPPSDPDDNTRIIDRSKLKELRKNVPAPKPQAAPVHYSISNTPEQKPGGDESAHEVPKDDSKGVSSVFKKIFGIFGKK